MRHRKAVAPGTAPEEPASSGSLLSRLPLSRLIALAVAIVGLYFVWPQLVSLFAQVPRLRSISWLWFALMGALEAGAFVCDWGLTRLTLSERSWFLVGTAQLTSNAASRVLPGGVAAGATASYELLAAGGESHDRIVAALTANTLVSAAVLLSLPVLALPAIFFGGESVGPPCCAGSSTGRSSSP